MVNHVQNFCFLFGESRSIFFINAERCRTLLDGTLMLSIYIFTFFLALFYTVQEERFQHYEQETYIFIIRLIVSGRNTWIKHTSTFFKAFFLLEEWEKRSTHGSFYQDIHRSEEKYPNCLLESSLLRSEKQTKHGHERWVFSVISSNDRCV